jgi:competence protein ComEC
MSKRILRSLMPVVALWLALTSPSFGQTMRVHFIDVGQGASTLIEFPCAAMLIDTGGESNGEFDSNAELMAYLDDFFERRPDLNNTFHSLILTHPHIDHTRGVPSVLQRYKILNAVTNGSEDPASGSAQQKTLHRRVARGEATADDRTDDIGFVAAEVHKIPRNRGLTNGVIDPVKCSNVDPKITLLWGTTEDNPGWPAAAFRNPNNHSVVTRIDFGASSLLITGDLQEDAIAALINHYKQSALLDVDVYQVGHHGSHNATTEPLLRAVTPKIAVMAMGTPTREENWSAWKYGHPRKVIVDLLERNVEFTRDAIDVRVATGVSTFEAKRIDRAIYGTGWDGSVVLEADTTGTWRNIKPRMMPGPTASLVDINSAAVADLSGLPRIGHIRAQAIVDHRTSNGPFRSVDELTEIRGIGPATILAIRDMVTIRRQN